VSFILMMAKVLDLIVVARNGFLLHATMEMICIFHTGYFDSGGAFQTVVLLCNGLYIKV